MASGFTVATTFTARGNLQRSLKSIGKEFGQVGRIAAGARRAVQGFAVGAVVGGAAAMAYGVREVGREFVDLDQAITNASSKWGPEFERGTTGFNDLMEAAKGIGLTTEHQAAQAASGLNFLAMAGFTAEESMALLPGVANLATAANLDFAKSTDIASDALGAFGMAYGTVEQKQTAFNKIMGQTAATVNKANTDISQWFEAVQSGAPSFTTAGQSMASFNTAVALLANNGIKGEKAGTSLRGVMANLSKTTGVQASTLRKLNVSVQDSSGNFRDFADILEDIDKATSKMGSAQKTGVLERLFGKRQMSQMSILLREGADRFRSLREEIEDSAGAEVELATKMRGSINNSIKLVQSALVGKGIDIIQQLFGGEDPADALTRLATKIQEFDIGPLVEDLREVIKTFKDSSKWIAENKDLIVALGEAFLMFKLGSWAADITRGVTALGGLTRGLGAAKRNAGGLNRFLAAAPGLVQALAAEYTVLKLAVKQVEEAQEATQERKRKEASIGRKFKRADLTQYSDENLNRFQELDKQELDRLHNSVQFGEDAPKEQAALRARIAAVDAEKERRRKARAAAFASSPEARNQTEALSQWAPWVNNRTEAEMLRSQQAQSLTNSPASQPVQRSESIQRSESVNRFEVDWGTPPQGVTINQSPLSTGEMP